MIPPCLTLSNIRYVSRIKWSNPGKGVVPSPTYWCSSYWKGAFWSPSTTVTNFTYLFTKLSCSSRSKVLGTQKYLHTHTHMYIKVAFSLLNMFDPPPTSSSYSLYKCIWFVIVFVISLFAPSKMAPIGAKNTWETYSAFLNWFNLKVIWFIWRLKQRKIK